MRTIRNTASCGAGTIFRNATARPVSIRTSMATSTSSKNSSSPEATHPAEIRCPASHPPRVFFDPRRGIEHGPPTLVGLGVRRRLEVEQDQLVGLRIGDVVIDLEQRDAQVELGHDGFLGILVRRLQGIEERLELAPVVGAEAHSWLVLRAVGPRLASDHDGWLLQPPHLIVREFDRDIGPKPRPAPLLLIDRRHETSRPA